MSAGAIGLVLVAAVLHVAWNSFVRSSGDRLIAIWSVVVGGASIAVVMLVATGVPSGTALGYLGLSAVLHIGYGFSLAAAYHRNDLSFAYPVARSMAPPLAAVGGVVLVGDHLSLLDALGIFVISLAIVLLVRRNQNAHITWPAITGIFIAGYTLSDGAGVRASQSTVAYISLLFVAHAVGFSALLAARPENRARMRDVVENKKRTMLLGGLATYGAYLLVLIAARTNPLGAVSALRETSTILAVFVGAYVLHERVPRRAFGAAAMAALGAAFLAM